MWIIPNGLLLPDKQLGCSFIIFALLLCGTGCSSSYLTTVPADLTKRVNHALSFPQIKESADSYKGTVVMLGGHILAAKRLQDSTQLTVLQLPLIDDQEPTLDLTQSQGRFLAIQQDFLDPATVPAGTKVTIIGEVSGIQTQSLDETTYDYPVLIIKHLKVWPQVSVDSFAYPPYYGYPPFYPYPFAYPFYGPRGRFYPYWYW